MRIEKEEKIVMSMIDLYYKKKYKNKDHEEALKLKAYVRLRLSKCPFKDNKGFCSACKIHCYEKNMRLKIKEVMRYSGPQMLIYHPLLAFSHIFSTLRSKIHGKK